MRKKENRLISEQSALMVLDKPYKILNEFTY